MTFTKIKAGAGVLCLAAAALPSAAQTCNFSDEVQYQVRFEATWSSATLPLQFPSNAHFSPLIGAVHNSSVSFWAPGGLATPGVERVAETGSTSTFTTEINQAVNADTALARITGGAVGQSPGAVATTFTVNTSFPLVSLITMIAPSPDWIVGVHDLNLLQGNNWVASLTVPLLGYDAGTDSGTTFTSANQDTQPQEPIALLGGPLVTVDGQLVPFGDFVFTRVTDSCVDSDGDDVGDDVDNCTLAANPDQTDANADGFGNACDADLSDDCIINVVDLGLLRSAFFTTDAVADLNGDGVVNVIDLGLMRASFFGAPGPSAQASCGG
ncbi:MAG: spondin domain-containing protein [Pseudomonadota bacterium]